VQPGVEPRRNFDISDPIALLNHLFVGGSSLPPPCGDNSTSHAANIRLLDLNGDGSVDVSDPIYGLRSLFHDLPRPANCWADSCPCILIPDCPIVQGDCAR
jgi:hypothetical protein